MLVRRPPIIKVGEKRMAPLSTKKSKSYEKYAFVWDAIRDVGAIITPGTGVRSGLQLEGDSRLLLANGCSYVTHRDGDDKTRLHSCRSRRALYSP